MIDKMSVIVVANEFVDSKPSRKSIFGKFVEDLWFLILQTDFYNLQRNLMIVLSFTQLFTFILTCKCQKQVVLGGNSA